jgi:hypothetical protein
MILPNMNSITENSTIEPAPHITSQMQIVLDYIKDNGNVTEPQIGKLLDVKTTRAYAIAKEIYNL